MAQPPLEQGMDLSTPGALERLSEHVLHRLSSRVHDLCLHLHSGGLVIRGRATTYYAKQLVQHAVMAVTVVPILANEIEVSAS
jgi:hypothetical protein